MDSHDSVLNVSEVIDLEKRLVEKGTSLVTLMQRAGGSVADWVAKNLDNSNPIVIFCGSGNNGGDGWVVADNLASQGYPVTLFTPSPAQELKVEPARRAALRATAKGYSSLSIIVDPAKGQIESLLAPATLVVDAILGTGFNGTTVKRPYAAWIKAINSTKRLRREMIVLAVDVPSGLSAQSGQAAEPCIVADLTITMLVYKTGLMTAAARSYCGDLQLARIAEVDGLVGLSKV